MNYPNAELDGATDFLYWSQYDYGKPVLRISHVTIYPTEEGMNASAIVTGKQIFFSHFFMAGLELHALVRDMKSEGDAFYLVSLIRMRTDGVGGLFGNMLKKSVQKDVMKNKQGYLDASKTAIERYYLERRQSAATGAHDVAFRPAGNERMERKARRQRQHLFVRRLEL